MHIYSHKIRNRCIKSKDHERNATRRPQISGVQSGLKRNWRIYIPVPGLGDNAYLRTVLSLKIKKFFIQNLDPLVLAWIIRSFKHILDFKNLIKLRRKSNSCGPSVPETQCTHTHARTRRKQRRTVVIFTTLSY